MRDELRAAVEALEQLARRNGRPDRYHARALLLALGELLRCDEDPGELLERVRRATTRFGPAWEEAASSELALACAEHVHSVDPRYLSLPNYDLEYTLAARERLEARLAAARELDLGVPEALLDGVRAADEMLAPIARKRRSEGSRGEKDANPG